MRREWVTIALTLALVRRLVPGAAADPAAVLSVVRPARAAGRSQPAAERLDLRQRDASRSASTRALKDDPDVARWSTYVGRGAIRFYLPLNVQLPNDFFAQAVIVAKDVAARERLRSQAGEAPGRRFPERSSAASIRSSSGRRSAGRCSTASAGPTSRRCARSRFKLAQVVATNPQAEHVNFDWIEPARQVRIRDRSGRGAAAGPELAGARRASSTRSFPARRSRRCATTSIWSTSSCARPTSSASRSTRCAPCRCRCRAGARCRSASSRRFEYEQDYPLVWRRDRVPTLTVQADVAPGMLPETVVSALAPADRGAVARPCPRSYRIAVGGTVEESAKSQASVVAVVPVMLLIMLTVLMVQLRSFQRLFLVLSVAPLGLIGVVAALLLSGKPLGFVAILGILALLGMITKNAVILIGQIEAERAQGKDVRQAAIDASSARFRPIMLTAVSTVLGMIPIAPTVFWGPMAFAIMGGLLVATILTLIFLPTLYVTWFETERTPAQTGLLFRDRRRPRRCRCARRLQVPLRFACGERARAMQVQHAPIAGCSAIFWRGRRFLVSGW